MPPDHSTKPQGLHPDFDDMCRQLQSQIRLRRKNNAQQRTNGATDLLDYDRLLGSLKLLRRKLSESEAPEKYEQAIAGFLAFLADNPVR